MKLLSLGIVCLTFPTPELLCSKWSASANSDSTRKGMLPFIVPGTTVLILIRSIHFSPNLLSRWFERRRKNKNFQPVPLLGDFPTLYLRTLQVSHVAYGCTLLFAFASRRIEQSARTKPVAHEGRGRTKKYASSRRIYSVVIRYMAHMHYYFCATVSPLILPRLRQILSTWVTCYFRAPK